MGKAFGRTFAGAPSVGWVCLGGQLLGGSINPRFVGQGPLEIVTFCFFARLRPSPHQEKTSHLSYLQFGAKP